MKSIQQIWEEYLNSQLKNSYDKPIKTIGELMRDCFFAGFNRMYCIANEGEGIKIGRDKNYLEITQYETEMDNHSGE